MKYILLSYKLSPESPLPDSNIRPMVIEQISSMDKGDISNTYMLKFWNHSGTHIDGSRHVKVNGRDVAHLDINEFIFERVTIVDITKGKNELIYAEDFKPFAEEIRTCDLLLVRTGIGKYRRSNKRVYELENPGFSVEAARFLTHNFPFLRGIGIDAISFAARKYVREGIEAHKILFDKSLDFVLIEDMSLPHDLPLIRRVLVVPLYIEGIDSCPCTVLAEVEY